MTYKNISRHPKRTYTYTNAFYVNEKTFFDDLNLLIFLIGCKKLDVTREWEEFDGQPQTHRTVNMVVDVYLVLYLQKSFSQLSPNMSFISN